MTPGIDKSQPMSFCKCSQLVTILVFQFASALANAAADLVFIFDPTDVTICIEKQDRYRASRIGV
eukprot:13335291-Heterocapsa_arctica.AAC.1